MGIRWCLWQIVWIFGGTLRLLVPDVDFVVSFLKMAHQLVMTVVGGGGVSTD